MYFISHNLALYIEDCKTLYVPGSLAAGYTHRLHESRDVLHQPQFDSVHSSSFRGLKVSLLGLQEPEDVLHQPQLDSVHSSSFCGLMIPA